MKKTSINNPEIIGSTIMPGAKNAIIAYDSDDIVIGWSAGAQLLLGYTPSEIIGQPIARLIAPGQPAPDLRRARGAAPSLIYGTLLHKGGWGIAMALALSPIVGSDGEVAGASVVLHPAGAEQLPARQSRAHAAAATGARQFVDPFDIELILAVAPHGALVIDADGVVRQINHLAELLFGYSAAELLGRSVDILLPALLRGRHQHHRQAFIATSQRRHMDVQKQFDAQRKDGGIFTVQIGIMPLDTPNGMVMLTSVVDVTNLKQIEQTLREHEQFNQVVLNSVLAHVAVLDRQGTILAVNEAWRNFAHANRVPGSDQAKDIDVGANYLAICRVSGDAGSREAADAYAGISAVLKGEQSSFTLEYPCHSPDMERWFSMTATPLATPQGGAVVAHTDITERKRADLDITAEIERRRAIEESLQRANRDLARSEQEFRSLAEHALLGIIRATPSGKIVYVNAALVHMLGYDAEAELMSQTTIQLYQNPQVREKVLRLIQHDGSISNYELELKTRDGTPKTMLVSTTRTKELLSGMMIDITERKRAEAALRESEERFRATFEQAAVGLAHVAPNGQWLRVNQRLCTIVGYTHEEMLALRFQDITYPDDLQPDLTLASAVLRGEIETYSLEKRYIHKSGALIWINLTVSLQRDETGAQYFISVVEDITARKRIEARAQAQAARLQVLAEVSRALAEATSDYQATLDLVARKTCLSLGDICAIRLYSDDGKLAQLASAYAADPAKLTLLPSTMDVAVLSASAPVRSVLESGKQVFIPVVDASDDDLDSWPIINQGGLHSIILVPMRYQSRVLGAMLVARYSPEQPPFDEDDLQQAQDLADRAALAIINARLFVQVQRELAERARAEDEIRQLNSVLERRVAERTASLQAEIAERAALAEQIRTLAEQATALAELSQALAEVGSELQPLFDTLARHVWWLMGDTATVAVLSEDRQQLQTRAVHHGNAEMRALLQDLFTATAYPVSQGLAGHVAYTGTPLLISNMTPSEARAQIRPEFHAYLEKCNIASMLIVPLRARGRILGTLGVS
ncbi:MAG TPA: PAS domain S-box protein, partial [Kouleothrix sp.]|nr:PAS domain S-box protein [Kouleothrix sp.]